MATNAGVPIAFPIGCRNYQFAYELLPGAPQVLRVHLQLLAADRSTLGSAYDYDVPVGAARQVPMQLCEKSMRAKSGPYSMLVEVSFGAHSAIEFSQALTFSAPAPVKKRIVCFKFKKVRVVLGVNPKCPVGYKLQRSPQN